MKRRRIIIGLLTGLIIITVLFIFLQAKDKNETGVLKVIADKADLYVRDFQFTEVGDPDTVWNIKADSARYMRNENIVVLDRVMVEMIRSDGTIYYLKGDEGRFHTDSKDMFISGNVEILSEHGDQVTTDYLMYSDAEKKASTDAMVTMKNDYVTLRGVGLTILMNRNHLVLLSEVDALIDSRVLK
jgi:LPS export ABC transporter protein LptC